MPKKAKELSALAVAKFKGDGRYAVGGVDGLYLRVTGNSRSWVLRIATGAGEGGSGEDGAGKAPLRRRDI